MRCQREKFCLKFIKTFERFVLSGSTGAWEQVLSGRVAPLLAIMSGKLKLTRGSLAELLPYVTAAKELVTAVASVPGVFGSRE